MSKKKIDDKVNLNPQWKKLVYNDMYENGYLNLDKEELYQLTKKLSTLSTNRRNKFKKFYKENDIPLPIAYKDTGTSQNVGKNFSYLEANFNVDKDMSLNQLRQKFKMLRAFMRTSTSTQKGWEKTLDNFADKLILTTVSKYKTIKGKNIKRSETERLSELDEKREEFKKDFMSNIGKSYRKFNYSTRRYENLTFYDILWRVYSRLEDRGFIQGRDNVQSETLKVIYDTLVRKVSHASIENIANTVEQILSNDKELRNKKENKSIQEELENASVDTRFIKLGGHF